MNLSYDFDIVVACCHKNGIGKDGDLPWKLKKEMKHFKKITTTVPEGLENKGYRNVVIMGRKTWESIPSKYKPLPNRYNVIITSKSQYLNDYQQEYQDNKVNTYKTLQSALETIFKIKTLFKLHTIFVIGGSQLYKEAIRHKNCRSIFMTKIYKKLECDKHFPIIPDNTFTLHDVSSMMKENDTYFRYFIYNNIRTCLHMRWENTQETQYLNILKDILLNGDRRQTRNAITLSSFGLRMEFDISTYFPILTTKRVYWKGVVEELLWFLRGSTNANELNERGVKIWNGNTTREFLDSRGLTHYKVGDIGPTYGFGFRHYGATYKGMDENYQDKGFDQIAYVLDELKNNPTSRRILINLWNPAVMEQMSLTPCACQYQFHVNDGKLTCQMYQRSADMFLGNPFNITSSSLFTYILARYSGLQPHKLIICLGDAHIYESHIDAVKQQLSRTPRPFPILKIADEVPEKIEELEYSHFQLIGYDPHSSIKANMVA